MFNFERLHFCLVLGFLATLPVSVVEVGIALQSICDKQEHLTITCQFHYIILFGGAIFGSAAVCSGCKYNCVLYGLDMTHCHAMMAVKFHGSYGVKTV